MIALVILYLIVIVLWCCLIRLLQRYFNFFIKVNQVKNEGLQDLKNRLKDQRSIQETSTQISLLVNTLVKERLQEMEQKLIAGKEERLLSPKLDTLAESLKDVLKADLNLLKTEEKKY